MMMMDYNNGGVAPPNMVYPYDPNAAAAAAAPMMMVPSSYGPLPPPTMTNATTNAAMHHNPLNAQAKAFVPDDEGKEEQ